MLLEIVLGNGTLQAKAPHEKCKNRAFVGLVQLCVLCGFSTSLEGIYEKLCLLHFHNAIFHRQHHIKQFYPILLQAELANK